MRAVAGSVAAWVAVLWVAGAAPGVSAEYRGMTQDLLLRLGPSSPFWFLWLICLVMAVGLSWRLLMRLKGRLDAGSPVGVVGVAVSVAAVGALWLFVWILAGAPPFGPLPVPVWPAD